MRRDGEYLEHCGQWMGEVDDDKLCVDLLELETRDVTPREITNTACCPANRIFPTEQIAITT